MDDCEKIGLKIERLEQTLQGKDLQDAVLSVHHAYMITFSASSAIKIIENQNGVAMVIQKNSTLPLSPQQLMPTPIQLPVQFPVSIPRPTQNK